MSVLSPLVMASSAGCFRLKVKVLETPQLSVTFIVCVPAARPVNVLSALDV